MLRVCKRNLKAEFALKLQLRTAASLEVGKLSSTEVRQLFSQNSPGQVHTPQNIHRNNETGSKRLHSGTELLGIVFSRQISYDNKIVIFGLDCPQCAHQFVYRQFVQVSLHAGHSEFCYEDIYIPSGSLFTKLAFVNVIHRCLTLRM